PRRAAARHLAALRGDSARGAPGCQVVVRQRLSRGTYELVTDIVDTPATGQSHREVDLATEVLEHRSNARFPVESQAPEHGPTNEDSARPESERLEHIRSTANSPVEQDLDTACDGVHDRQQYADRGGHTVELTATMVRYDDRRGAVLDGETRVIGREHALDDHREVRDGF